ncbi:uncharacterized protein GatB isoform X2 [Panulirus ornatus]|uniref:uncharacterized protein GatB isoform X2 n=1 Tax=Panulirus ornatus TaxID=150431 RepID=UPI003A891F23
MRYQWRLSKNLPNIIQYYSSAQCNPALLRDVWQPVIGLEIHAQISSASKLFSRVSTTYGAPPNTQVGIFESSHPGTLPVLNKRCVEAGIKTALAFGATVNKMSQFDRKHYFYPDLPAGYQITQFYHPLASNGRIEFIVYNPAVHKFPYRHSVELIQLQLEEDSGKSIHDKDNNRVLVDLNRAGQPLMELVFAPGLRNGEEAAAMVKEVALILTRIGTCNSRMHEGSLRVDANISVHKPGEPLGTRTEVKNLNSLRSLVKAIDFEVERQLDILESGGFVTNETRSFDTVTQETKSMRDKEVIQDYRFMPEPNLLPLRLHDSSEPDCLYNGSLDIKEIHALMPELPEATRERLVKDYGITLKNAILLVSDDDLFNFFMTVMSSSKRNSKLVCNLLLTNLLGALNAINVNIKHSPLSASAFGEIVDLQESGRILTNISQKLIYAICIDKDLRTPTQIVHDNNWIQISNEDALEELVERILNDNLQLALSWEITMVGRTLVLRWNDHHATFMHMLSEIRQKEQYCDATILCEGHFYEVHRFVLATCSTYFEQMFSRVECKHHPMIVLTDIKAVQLEALLIYMYKGELSILQKNLPGILRAATSLKVRGLSEGSDHEVDMEIDTEIMTQPNFDVPHIQESNQRNALPMNRQLGRECSKRVMDFDNQCKTVKRTRQTDSSMKLVPSSRRRESSFEVTEICTDIMQQPSTCHCLSMVEPVVPCQRQSELPSAVSIAENDSHHGTFMLWKAGLNISAQNDTDPRQKYTLTSAVSPSVESIMEEIEVKNEIIELMPEENCVFENDSFVSTQICNSDQADCSVDTGTTQQNSLQDRVNEVPSFNAPSTSSMSNFHNNLSVDSSRLSLQNDVIENCVGLCYPVESSYVCPATYENSAELNNSIESRCRLVRGSRYQSGSSTVTGDHRYEGRIENEFHFDVGHDNPRIERVAYTDLEPAVSLAKQKKENRMQTTLPCSNPPDNPVPVKRGRGRPRKIKNITHTDNIDSEFGSGTALEMEDANSRSQIAQNGDIEYQVKHSHDTLTVRKASQPKQASRKKRGGPRPILRGYRSNKRGKRKECRKQRRNTQNKSLEVYGIDQFPEDSQVTRQNTGIQKSLRGKSQMKEMQEAKVRSRPYSKKVCRC